MAVGSGFGYGMSGVPAVCGRDGCMGFIQAGSERVTGLPVPPTLRATRNREELRPEHSYTEASLWRTRTIFTLVVFLRFHLDQLL